MGISGVGALIGALILASRQNVLGLGRWIAHFDGVFSATLIVFAYSRWFLPVGGALLVPIGFSVMIQMGSTNTLIQSMTPDHLRGRVLAAYSMMLMGMAPIGALIAGCWPSISARRPRWRWEAWSASADRPHSGGSFRACGRRRAR